LIGETSEAKEGGKRQKEKKRKKSFSDHFPHFERWEEKASITGGGREGEKGEVKAINGRKERMCVEKKIAHYYCRRKRDAARLYRASQREGKTPAPEGTERGRTPRQGRSLGGDEKRLPLSLSKKKVVEAWKKRKETLAAPEGGERKGKGPLGLVDL